MIWVALYLLVGLGIALSFCTKAVREAVREGMAARNEPFWHFYVFLALTVFFWPLTVITYVLWQRGRIKRGER